METSTKQNENNWNEMHNVPTQLDPEGDGWSKDIILTNGTETFKGYYDPRGSIAGGKYFYYGEDAILDCNILPAYPTKWKYFNK
jgi:hypothetical protein